MTSTPTPAAKNIRLTISVTPEVHAVFLRLSKNTNTSIGRAMGEWLGDTLDAAELMASTVEKARSAPSLAIRELQAFTLGLQDELAGVMSVMRNKGIEDRAQIAAAGLGPAPARSGARTRAGTRTADAPPPSNTGGKGTKRGENVIHKRAQYSKK